jgi:hypothetical protein
MRRMEMRRTSSVAVVLAAALLGGGFVQAADDDLAVVKKAVAASDTPKESAAATPKAVGRQPQWFKVRVNERTGKKITVNLPLSLVRALGDDFPIDFHCGRRHATSRCDIKISEVLAQLEAGQSLVEVDGDDETIRVWVE